MTSSVVLTFLLSTWSAAGPAPQTQESPTAEEQAVRQAVASYADTYNHGDANALASHFADDAQYIRLDGTIVKGRQGIREKLAQTLADQKGGRMSIHIDSIEFHRGRMATVRGIGTVSFDKGEPVNSAFKAVHVKRGEKWPIKSIEELGDRGEQLDQLDWMVGTWLDEDEDTSIRTVCDWTSNHRFLSRSFVASYREGPELRGTEIIGWDPAARTIRSWVFDSDGSFGQSIWTHRGEGWIVKSRGVLPDGGRASAVHIYTVLGPDKYTWESVGREIDGEIMPDIAPITIVRSTTQPADATSERHP